MAADHVIDRSMLHFPEEVKCRFAFLEALDFHCVRSEATFIRYESPVLGINIYQGRLSYEIGLELESRQAPEESYSIFEILRLIDDKRAEGYRNFSAHTVEGVAEGVRQLAELFHECLNVGVLSDKQFLPRLKLQRADLSRNYWLEMEMQQARSRLEDAWVKKDFGKVVKILSPLQEHLQPAELKKLEYAKKHQ